MTSSQPPTSPETPVAERRTPWLRWVLIGCGGTTLIAVLIIAGLMMFGFFKAKEIVEEIREDPAKVIADVSRHGHDLPILM